MEPKEITGRFLPSRVYCRWKWIVRLGLMLVPFLVLLAGGVTLYLSPNKYRSTTLIILENGPPPEEIIELVKSRGVLDRVVERLDLAKRFNMDRDTAVTVIRDATEARIVPDTRMIDISVSLSGKVEARDIAEQIPVGLKEHLVNAAEAKMTEKASEMRALIREASDAAKEKATALANLVKVHGPKPEDPAVAVRHDRASRASLLADAEVERLQKLLSARFDDHVAGLPRLSVHTAPVIADKAHAPKVDEELGTIVLQALLFGLLSALLLPYLMELVFAPVQDESGSEIKGHSFDCAT